MCIINFSNYSKYKGRSLHGYAITQYRSEWITVQFVKAVAHAAKLFCVAAIHLNGYRNDDNKTRKPIVDATVTEIIGNSSDSFDVCGE